MDVLAGSVAHHTQPNMVRFLRGGLIRAADCSADVTPGKRGRLAAAQTILRLFSRSTSAAFQHVAAVQQVNRTGWQEEWMSLISTPVLEADRQHH